MAVRCRQSGAGIPTEEHIIEAHPDLDTDLALLERKALGAADKGWLVEWTGDRSFTATKDRWGGTIVTREFWAD